MKNMKLAGYVLTGVDGSMLGQLLAEQWDWRLLVAYFAGGLGGVVMGHYL